MELPAGDLDQGERLQRMQRRPLPRAGRYESAVGSFHEVGEDPRNEDKEEREGSQQESRAGDAGMGHPQCDEEKGDKQRGGVAEVARARPRQICCDGDRQQEGEGGTGAQDQRSDPR